jgi:hypothetical protein
MIHWRTTSTNQNGNRTCADHAKPKAQKNARRRAGEVNLLVAKKTQ